MAYAPPLPLPVPASMPAVHPSIVSLDLSGLGLLSAEEASSNEQLEFTVGVAVWLGILNWCLHWPSCWEVV